MLCKVCNTRVAPGRSACPNCGSNSLSALATADLESTAKLPQLEYEADSAPLETEAPDIVELNEPAEVNVELDEPVEVELNDAAEVASGESDVPQEEKDDPPPAAPVVKPRATGPLGTPDALGLRAMLVDRPTLLEPGLSVYTNEKGKPLGAGYTSAVGVIDLLATDADGVLVVVMVAEPHQGADLVSGVLQRIGWVRKHLCSESQRVRGIVLMDQPRDSIVYAAAAVADTVEFRVYRVALTFEKLDV
jgi:hypothetical protein